MSFFFFAKIPIKNYKNSDKKINFCLFQEKLSENEGQLINISKIKHLASLSPNLTVEQYMQEINCSVELDYFLKFWGVISLSQNLVVIDDELIRWLGFSGKINNARTHCKASLKNARLPYKELNYSQVLEFASTSKFETKEKKYLKQMKIMGVTGRTFKELSMVVKTQQAHRIRTHYLDLEEIFTGYTMYQNEVLRIDSLKKDTELSKITSKNQTLQNSIDDIRTILMQNQQNVQEYRAQNNQLLERLDQIHGQNNELIGQNNELIGQNNELHDDVAHIQSDLNITIHHIQKEFVPKKAYSPENRNKKQFFMVLNLHQKFDDNERGELKNNIEEDCDDDDYEEFNNESDSEYDEDDDLQPGVNNENFNYYVIIGGQSKYVRKTKNKYQNQYMRSEILVNKKVANASTLKIAFRKKLDENIIEWVDDSKCKFQTNTIGMDETIIYICEEIKDESYIVQNPNGSSTDYQNI
jgi:hypothetical protein